VPDLSGQYAFLDRTRLNLDEGNQTLSNIDTASGRFCLAGLVEGTDASPLPNRQVSFEYRSNGSIEKANAKRVTADFAQVDLTLTIEEGGSPVFTQTITTGCKLKGRLRKAGDSQKVRLRCDAGEDLAAFGLADGASSALRDSIANAFPKAGRKHIKVDVTKGRLRFTHNGEPAPSNVPVTLGCDLGGGDSE
jgi:hypothetical protein